MTRKDHILLADAIRDLSKRQVRLAIVNSLIFRLKADNKTFNPDEFERACNV